MGKNGLLESLEKNLRWFVLEIDANEFGSAADAYINKIIKNINNNGYEVKQVFKKKDEEVYHIHINNKSDQ